MPQFLLDTSCMIAAICAWHEHHTRAVAEIEHRLGRSEMLVVAAPALVESYAVLTRLPLPHRLSPAKAMTLLESNFMNDAELVTLDEKSYRELLLRAPTEGIVGGRLYDAVIAECAFQARVPVVLTFNARHFQTFVKRDLEVVVP